MKLSLTVSRNVLLASLAIAFAHSALAANGVFITKPNAWDPASQVDETKFFTSYEDHNAYLTFTLSNGSSEQVDKAVLTALIWQPVIPAAVIDKATLDQLTQEQLTLKAAYASHPTARPYIGKWYSALSQAIASYKPENLAPNAIPKADTTSVETASTHVGTDLITLDGKRYQSVTISHVEPDGLEVVTDSGVDKVLFTNLPPTIQKQYGYDPARAVQYEAAEQAAASQRAADAAQRVEDQSKEAARTAVSQALDKVAVLVAGKVLSVSDDGVLLTDAVVKIPATHNVVVSRNPLDGSAEQVVPQAGFDNVDTNGEPIFIYGAKSLADGDQYSDTVYPAPDYSYTSTIGAAKTVHAFAATKELSLKLLRQSQ
jgi:hypothetical protein